MVHFSDAFLIAKYNTLTIASSVGNVERFFPVTPVFYPLSPLVPVFKIIPPVPLRSALRFHLPVRYLLGYPGVAFIFAGEDKTRPQLVYIPA
jgi:hypothetical protein